MKTCILTSRLDTHDYDEFGVRVAHHFGNENGILDTLLDEVKGRDLLVYVASSEDNYDVTDMYANLVFSSFDMTMPFKNYAILDGRREKDVGVLLKTADFIILGGGHVPTQKAFFDKIGLKDILSEVSCPVLGVSAGSMNMASIVYCPPELEGEALDQNFVRYFDGLGLCDINIFPHYNDMKDFVLDGKRMMEDIVYPDTYRSPVLIIPDGTYVLVREGKVEKICGESYLVKDGKIV